MAGAGLSAAVAEDDLRAKASAELSLGDLHWHRTRYPEAVERYTTAVGDSRRAGWPEGEAVARGNLGLAHWRSGRLPAAVEELTRSLDLARRTGWRAEEVSALGTLGAVSAELGLLEQAAGHFTAALALTPDAGPGRAGLLDGLGEISRFRGRLDQALDQLTQALAMFGELGEARARRALGAALRDTEGPAAAPPQWRDALAIFTAAGAAPEAGALRDLLSLDR